MDTIGRLISTSTTKDGALRAELWADAMVKILSCWIPIVLASFVVGGNLIVPSLECFPMHLVSAVTHAGSVNGSSAEALVDPRMYSKQLDDFVYVNCSKQTSFSYQVFTMMLVAQSVVMFAPHLVWNITRGREVICKLQFIRQYIEVLYETLGPKDDGPKDDQAPDVPKHMASKIFVEKLFEKNKIYHRYIAIHVSTAILIVVFILAFCVVPYGSVYSIKDRFKCEVGEKFSVDCAVSFASLYRISWWTNLVSLIVSFLTIIVHMFYLHCRLDDEPFNDIGIKFVNKTGNKVNDCHLIYAFLKANANSIEKYNYVAILLETLKPEKRNTAQNPLIVRGELS